MRVKLLIFWVAVFPMLLIGCEQRADDSTYVLGEWVGKLKFTKESVVKIRLKFDIDKTVEISSTNAKYPEDNSNTVMNYELSAQNRIKIGDGEETFIIRRIDANSMAFGFEESHSKGQHDDPPIFALVSYRRVVND